jgi:molecular chaperone HtpG
MTNTINKEEHIKFDAEVGKILQLMIHSLYENKDIFLRELVSNASDACDKLRYLSLTNPDLIKNDSEFKIKISVDEEKRILTISDNGIGMNREDLIDNIGTIARSGIQGFLSKLTGCRTPTILTPLSFNLFDPLRLKIYTILSSFSTPLFFELLA